jgi:hypothetical protein
LELGGSQTSGTISGEGSAFFMISAVPVHDHPVTVEGVHTFFTPQGVQFGEIETETDSFLEMNGLSRKHIDIAVLGINGDFNSDVEYRNMMHHYFAPDTHFAMYKHLCGEYYTSSAFALWLGLVILENQTIPGIAQVMPATGKSYRKLLIYNHYRNSNIH